MQRSRFLPALAAAVAAGSAVAQTAAQGPAPGARPEPQPIAWRCEGQACAGGVAPKPTVPALLRECEKVVEAVGRVSGYRSRGVELPPEDLARCNRYATRTPVSLR